MTAWAFGAWAADAWAIGTWEGIYVRRSGGFVRPVIYVKDKKPKEDEDAEIAAAVLEALPPVSPVNPERLKQIVNSLVRRDKAPKLRAKERQALDLSAIRDEIERQRERIEAENQARYRAFLQAEDEAWLMMS
jgi:hypothetical protein